MQNMYWLIFLIQSYSFMGKVVKFNFQARCTNIIFGISPRASPTHELKQSAVGNTTQHYTQTTRTNIPNTYLLILLLYFIIFDTLVFIGFLL